MSLKIQPFPHFSFQVTFYSVIKNLYNHNIKNKRLCLKNSLQEMKYESLTGLKRVLLQISFYLFLTTNKKM